ncbi:MAG TPA: carboxyltransferase domain-containing protein [Solirubrobacterales bacterium]|jgi:urea carboxylase
MSGFETRYTHGGDEWVLIELDEAMSLGVNMRAQAISERLLAERVEGVVDVCCANASCLVRIDPDRLDPRDAISLFRELEAEVGDAGDLRMQTRVVEVPMLWEDEWTHEVLMKFRDHHQTPDKTDIEFAAELNGFASTDEFRAALFATPLLGTMTGFAPGATWWYPLTTADKLIEVPKYVRPRTDTPERAFSWGGAFAAIYPARGAGGYQLFGIVAAPQVDPSRRLADFREHDWFFEVGDLAVLRAVERDEYEAIRAEVEAGSFRYRQAPLEFAPAEFLADPAAVQAAIRRAIDGA